MSNSAIITTREAVRIKVKKCNPNAPPEWRKFSIDPQITTLDILHSILAKAFELKTDFSIKYKAYDPAGNEIYLAVLSDWDLDAAFLRVHNLSVQTSSEPCLTLELHVKPYAEFKEWKPKDVCNLTPNTNATVSGILNTTARDIMSPFQQSLGASQKYVQQMHNKLPSLIMNQMEKTFSMVQKAFNLSEETMAVLPPRPPLSDSEFRLFLDALGQIRRTDELRKVIFFGGIDPSLRRVVWKHILNVYPSGMNGHQRMDYMRRKSEYYYKLRASWMKAIKEGCTTSDLTYVTSMVRKDVLRTDRLHTFYAGNDDNKNIASLFNILTTYALNHPSVSYCQGMSDIASPLLVTMNDEAHAYICFCAIMKRVRGNFMLDGIAMTRKFNHLTEALSFYDPEFWEYLKLQQADDLLFCYRWLLLELKREFPFEDSLRMLEVQWSSLKYNHHVDKELMLYEKEFTSKSYLKSAAVEVETEIKQTQKKLTASVVLANPLNLCQFNSTYEMENAYRKLCSLRRQKSTSSLTSLNGNRLPTSSTNNNKLYLMKRLNQSLDDNMPSNIHNEYYNYRRATKSSKSLDEIKIQQIIKGIGSNGENIKEIIQLGIKSNEINANNVHIDNNTGDDGNNVLIERNLCEFHDTNPFKDDVLASNSNICKNRITNNVPKAFLNSSSSSSNTSCENILTGDVACEISHVATCALDDKVSTCEETIDTNKVPPLSTSVTVPLTYTHGIPKSIANLQSKNVLSNYQAVSNIIAKQLAHANTINETIKRSTLTGGNHFKDLKEKIAATNRKNRFYLNNNFQNETATTATTLTDIPATTQLNLVRNFNEFLNLTAIDKNSLNTTEHPLQSVTTNNKNGDDNDKCDIKVNWFTSENHDEQDTNIQQPLSKHSLLQLNKDDLRTSCIDDLTSLSNTTLNSDQNQHYQQHRRTVCSNSFVNLHMYNSFASTTCVSPLPFECTKILTKSLDVDIKNNIPNIQNNFQTKNYKSLDNHLFHDNNYLHDSDEQHNGKLKHSNINEVEYTELNNDSIDDTKKLNHISGANTFKERHESTCSSFRSYSSNLLQVHDFADNNEDSFAELAQEEPQQKQLQLQPEQCNEDDCCVSHSTMRQLPSPTEFGDGNPFLIFLCLTLLLQHRNTIMRANMDYNEIAMHFDKMVRRHDVTRVLNQARRMYIDYLKMQETCKQQEQHPQEEQWQYQQESEQEVINLSVTQQTTK